MLLLLVVIVSFWQHSYAEICVLEPLVTVYHPKCQPPTNCTGNHSFILRNNVVKEVYEPLPPLTPGSPAFSHFLSVRSDDGISSLQQIFIEGQNQYVLTPVPVNICENTTSNASSKYRSYDGSNNNLNHSDWGTAYSAMLRFLVPRYNGPNGGVAKSVDGSDLPNVRLLSTLLFPYVNRPSSNLSLATMQWGQLVAHDSGLSPNSQENCCTNTSVSADQCMTINIPANDPFYSKYNQTCLNMMRSNAVPAKFGCLQYPNQISSVTQYIDLSFVYGSNLTKALSLRQCKGGLLLTSTSADEREFLPLSDDPMLDCNVPYSIETCFRAGDTRVNQNTQHTCMQIVFLREHNRIAKALAALNPNWDDERLYQETRAILIATFQHITYNEWLPLTIGKEYMQMHNLYPLKTGYSYNYSSEVNAGTINSFMTGAFRALHAGIQGQIHMLNTTTRCPFATLNISYWMLKPGIIVPKPNLDGLLLDLTVEPVQEFGRFFTTQMTEMMFHDRFPYGEDLASYDIQRGRDHGIPSYNDMRELCHIPRAKNFSDLIDDMGKKHVRLLKRAYNHVDDVDYYVGGILETAVEGITIGPSFLCLLGEQFVRKKFGDRFWYENGDQPHSFSEEQLQEIRKATLSRLFCDNSDNITSIRPNSYFYTSTDGNDIVPCSSIPALNLTAWIEK